jgi:hypothetical protein
LLLFNYSIILPSRLSFLSFNLSFRKSAFLFKQTGRQSYWREEAPMAFPFLKLAAYSDIMPKVEKGVSIC